MSTIFGIINKHEKVKDDLKKMQTAMAHWQADKSDVWSLENVGIGCLLLFNTPESLFEILPYNDAKNQLVITADARVDNREELASLLYIDKKALSAVSDSQLILFSYKTWGTDCTKYLLGDFAFAIWDERKKCLFCARDHIGVKPFFYACINGQFLFASEKKGILAVPGFDTKINREYVHRFLLRPAFKDAVSTAYAHIQRLPPAHALIFNFNECTVSVNRYWALEPTQTLHFKDENQYQFKLLDLLETAVKCRIRSNFPIGVELSGGIDSSVITSIGSSFLRKSDKNLISFSSTFSADKLDQQNAISRAERQRIEDVIKMNDITDYVFITQPMWDDLLEQINFLLKIYDGPDHNVLKFLLSIKSQASKKNVRSMLSGFVGDQIVTYGGEHSYLYYREIGDKKNYKAAIRKKHKFQFLHFLNPDFEFFLHKINNLLNFYNIDNRRVSAFFPIPASVKFNRGDIIWQDDSYRERNKTLRHHLANRVQKTAIGLRTELETRTGIGYQIEPRYPMADVRLLEYYLSIPNHLKIFGSQSREFFKKTVTSYLPESFSVANTKLGNMAPYELNVDKWDRAIDYFLDRISQIGDRPKYKYQEDFFKKQYSGNLGSYCMVLKWLEHHFEI